MSSLKAMGSEVLSALRERCRARREAPRRVPKVPADGPVLEIGAGRAPHARADVLPILLDEASG